MSLLRRAGRSEVRGVVRLAMSGVEIDPKLVCDLLTSDWRYGRMTVEQIIAEAKRDYVDDRITAEELEICVAGALLRARKWGEDIFPS